MRKGAQSVIRIVFCANPENFQRLAEGFAGFERLSFRITTSTDGCWVGCSSTGIRLRVLVRQRGYDLALHDQDAINAVFFDEIKTLDCRWNLQARMYRCGRRAAPHDCHTRGASPT